MAGRTEQVRVDLVATGADEAARDIDKVADAAKDVEKLDPEVEVTADTTDAERAVRDVRDDIEALDRQDAEVLLRAKVDQAKGELKSLQAELKQTGERAQTTAKQLDQVDRPAGGGGNLRGNAIADLTGPLGEASSAASDFAGVFDGIGDAAEAAAGKIGLTSAQAGIMSSAIGGLGVAAAGAAALWSIWNQRQAKAAEEAKRVAEAQKDLNEALREGDFDQAARSFVDGYGTILKAAERAGISAEEAADFIAGTTDAIGGFDAKLRDLNRAAETNALGQVSTDAVNAAAAWENLGLKLDDARGRYADTNGTLEEQAAVLGGVESALRRTVTESDRTSSAQERLQAQVDRTREKFNRMRDGLSMERAALRMHQVIGDALDDTGADAALTADEILGIKEAVLDAAETAKLNPVEVRSLLERVDAGDIAGVLWDTQVAIDRAPEREIPTEVEPPKNTGSMLDQLQQAIWGRPLTVRTRATGGGGGGGGGSNVPTMVPVVNVTQNFPRGARIDAVTEARQSARRHGRLYTRGRP